MKHCLEVGLNETNGLTSFKKLFWLLVKENVTFFFLRRRSFIYCPDISEICFFFEAETYYQSQQLNTINVLMCSNSGKTALLTFAVLFALACFLNW